MGKIEIFMKIMKCKQALHSLKAEMQRQSNSIEIMNNVFQQEESNMTANPDSAMGLIITTFDEKEVMWKEHAQEIIREMDLGITGLEISKGLIESKISELEAELQQAEA